MKDYGIEVFWLVDLDYFKTQKGMEIPKTMTFNDIEPYLAAYKADYPDQYPLILAKGGITSWANFVDWVSEDAQIALSYGDIGTDKENTVRLCYEMPEFVDRIKTIRSWYEKGYINPDAAVIDSIGRAAAGVIQSGQAFYGADSIYSNARQKATAIVRYDGPFLSTYSLRGALTAISAASKHPKEALKLIEFANTNKEYRNMMRYGIEGVHYNKNADGTVSKTQQGVTNYSPWAYTQASYSLSAVEASAFPAVPADPNMWQVIWDGYKDATVSSSLGFTFDYTKVANEVNAAKAIKEMYWAEMITGTSDPEVIIPQIIKELEDAGIRNVITEAQKQLDTFLGK
jgi:putative aldouronate transport system substrate-binding protein